MTQNELSTIGKVIWRHLANVGLTGNEDCTTAKALEAIEMAAAEIAIEADRRIAELEAQLATANERIAELEAVFGEFGEADGKCKDCGSPVALVSGSTSWGIDEEAFGQNDDIPDGLKRQAEDCRYDGVEIGGELSGHFCLKCQKLTSLYRHSF